MSGRAHGSDIPLFERHLTAIVTFWALYFAVQAPAYIPEVFSGPPTTRPFAINCFTKDLIFVLVLLLARSDRGRRPLLVGAVSVGMTAITTLLLLTILTGDDKFSFPPPRFLKSILDIAEGSRAEVWFWLALATAIGLWATTVAAQRQWRRWLALERRAEAADAREAQPARAGVAAAVPGPPAAEGRTWSAWLRRTLRGAPVVVPPGLEPAAPFPDPLADVRRKPRQTPAEPGQRE